MKHLKRYKIFESILTSLHMNSKYGEEKVKECDSVIMDIKDMSLELQDSGIFVSINYTPMTLVLREDSPKIIIDIQADEKLFASKISDIHEFTDRVLSYVKSLGFSTGTHTWTRDSFMIRQILIQK